LIRDRPLSERDPYTSLVWLAGQTALKNLNPARSEAEADVRTLCRRLANARQPGQGRIIGRAARH
jgi:hypothetical protein